VAVDTMCSSSLSAIHLACESLRRGESELALAGGVNLIVHPQKYALLSQGRFASTDGRCRAFGEGGDGYVPGEGVGAVLLKPLERALADGDAIHAVIRGSALNHGGRLAGSGYTVPSPLAQADVIRQALEDAGVPPESISYIEAHGTGTALGDPVEISGLSKIFGQAGHAIAVGSVKSNIGHLESAAGIAGLTKVLLQLKHRRIAPSLLHHPEGQLNAKIDFASTPFVVPTAGREWTSTTGPRRAALSAFGAGGSNAHLILEEAPEAAPASEHPGPQLIVLSAQNKSRLQAVARQLADTIETDRPALPAIVRTLQRGREAQEERLAFVAESTDQVVEQLRAFADENSLRGLQGRHEAAPKRTFADAEGVAFLRSLADRGAWQKLGELWVSGEEIAWDALTSLHVPPLRLPAAPLGGDRYWLETPATAASAPALHPLLDANASTFAGLAFTKRFSSADWVVREHTFRGAMLLPGVASLEMARAAAALSAPDRAVASLQDVQWLRPLSVGKTGATIATIKLTAEEDRVHFEIASGGEGEAARPNAKGAVLFAPAATPAPIALPDFATLEVPTAGEAAYAALSTQGLDYGPRFQLIQERYDGETESWSILKPTEAGNMTLLPAVLDAGLQTLAGIHALNRSGKPALPFGVREVRWHGDLSTARYAWARQSRKGYTVLLLDSAGSVLAELIDVTVREVSGGSAARVQPVAQPSERVDRLNLSERLRGVVAGTLKLPPARLGLDDDFEKFGLQSTQVMDMTYELEKNFGMLPKTLFFEYRTLRELGAYFAQHHPAKVAQWGTPTPPVTIALATAKPVVVSKARLVTPRDLRDEPIAIIGLAGRFPQARTLDELAANLRAGRDCIERIPPGRWDTQRWSTTADGKPLSGWGGFLESFDRFDARFFRMAPREAELIDPQERLFLETAWEALEDAALTRESLSGEQVGVYAGVMHGLYQLHGLPTQPGEASLPLGSAYWSIANRVSAFFNFNGPSLAVDTACSSSLAAIHLACQSLRSGESTVAIAGGVNISSHPQKYLQLAQMHFSSTDGRCRSFGRGGDGYVPAEGVGVIVLKPLSRAQADGDPIWGVIRGSAINHGGTSNGYTVPSPVAQGNVIADALQRAGVESKEISYIEAHGTGTALGDPIELAGLNRAFGARAGKCALGSVKSNIGHLESAAGIAALAKVLLQMRERMLYPSIHADEINPALDFEHTPFALQRTLAPWSEERLLAGISSFGAGGANAHLVVEEAPKTADGPTHREPQLVVLSARDEAALQRRVSDLAAFLDREDPSLDAIATTLQFGREALPERLALVAADTPDLREQLKRLLAGRPALARARTEERDDRDVTDLVQHRDLATLATAWVEGASIPWAALHKALPRRLHLPVYRFEGPRYWVPERPAMAEPVHPIVEKAPAAPLHYLVPQWQIQEVATREVSGRTLLIGLPQPLAERIEHSNQNTVAAPHVPLSEADWKSVLQEAAREGQPISRIVIQAPAEHAFTMLVGCGRALVRWRDLASVHLICLSRGAAETTALAGFLRSLQLEDARIRGTVLTLPTEADLSRDATAIAAELAIDPTKVEVRRTGEQREVRGWQPLAEQTSAFNLLRRQGTYVLTGGAGGVGALLARHLAEQFSARLILLGRRSADPAVETLLADLASAGGEARYWAVDVGDEGALATALVEAREAFGPIYGVVHSAGVIRDALLRSKQDVDLAAVLAPKLDGTRRLDRCTQGDPLDFFALFSSLAACTGNPGQCDYAYANRFMEAYAQEREARRQKGRCSGASVAIHWPYWQEGGMRLGEVALAKMRALGLEPLNATEGLTAFARAVSCGQTSVAVIPGRRDAVYNLLGVHEPAKASTPSVSPSPVPAPAMDLVAQIKAAAGAVIKVAPEDLDEDESFLEYGFDSVSLAELAAALTETLGVEIDAALFFETPTVSRLAERLRELGLEGEPVQRPAIAVVSQEAPADRTSDPDEAIAIVGMSGIFPGSPDLDTFWANLMAGRDLIGEAPAERWDWQAFTSEKGGARWGGFIDDIETFDPRFFGLSAYEAERMDPQQRLFLRLAWHALEDATLAPQQLRGANGAIIFGAAGTDYNELFCRQGLESSALTATGMAHSILANRLSHWLDWRGSSEPVDTACSSSLVALHRACEQLRGGECDLALTGGVNLLISPSLFVSFTQAGMLSPRGRCRTFDAAADGYVRGEGAGVLVLKRLADARREGLPVHAVIRGSAVGHGGRSASLTAPSPEGQAEVIARAWQRAGIDFANLGMIEAHGTGTPLGDPVEIAGLKLAFKRCGADLQEGACALGSVKTNIGHLETAAGIAGVIKTVLALRHRQLPGNPHLQTPNPQLKLAGSPLRLLGTRSEPWAAPQNRGRRCAGVSSFGFGGVNAHVVLEEAPAYLERERPRTEGPQLAVLSAKQDERLRESAGALAEWLAHHPDAALADVCHTLQVGRDAHRERLALVVHSVEELQARLVAFTQGKTASGIYRGQARKGATHAVDPTLDAIAQAWVHGAEVDWLARPETVGARRLHLPGYAFAMERYWLPQPVGDADVLPTALAEPTPRTSSNLQARLRAILAEVSGFDPAQIEPTTEFDELGFDSLMVKRFNDEMETLVPGLPQSILFEHRNLQALAAYFSAEHPTAFAEEPPLVAKQPTAPAIVKHTLAPPADEPIAIIGIAGRYPQAADLQAFWRNLVSGRDCITEFTGERASWTQLFDPDPERANAGRLYSKWGGFLDELDTFDPLFFKITPAEAELMDPQERLFLQTVWHAFEDAGHTPETLGRSVGVFAGITNLCYALHGAAQWQRGTAVFPSASPWSITNRVSYLLDLQGPSVPVDTACSSSLVALHQACESLRRGECRTAIAGGVNLYLHASKYVSLCQLRMLSPRGRCHSFGTLADGFVPGEGVGALLLKPLSRALADGDHIHALVRGSATNHCGKSNGYTVPNPAAQAAVVEAALRQAGLQASDISCVEAHGTGTALGDPLEIDGLRMVFSEGRCALSSVKSQIGHLEAAAGIAGVTKLILQLRHRQFAPSLHAREINPRVRLAGSPFFIPQEATAWEADQPRRAGISSFGAGGANAHVILEEYSQPETSRESLPGAAPFALSARTPEQLRQRAADLSAWLDQRHSVDLAAIAHTLQKGRRTWEHRLVLAARDRDELQQALMQVEAGEPLSTEAPGLTLPEVPVRRVPLPLYPFARERYWLPGTSIADLPFPVEKTSPLVFAADSAILRDHVVQGRPILPGAALLWAAAQAHPGQAIADVVILEPAVAKENGLELYLLQEDTRHFIADAETETRYLEFTVSAAHASPPPLDLAALQRRLPQQHAPNDLYEAFARRGVDFGPAFRLLQEVRAGADEALAKLAPSPHCACLLDAALQALSAFADDSDETWVPFAVDRFRLHGDLLQAGWAHARRVSEGEFAVRLLDNAGRVLAEVDGFRLRRLSTAAHHVALPDCCFAPQWEPVAAGALPEAQERTWCVLGHTIENPLARQLCRDLKADWRMLPLTPDLPPASEGRAGLVVLPSAATQSVASELLSWLQALARQPSTDCSLVLVLPEQTRETALAWGALPGLLLSAAREISGLRVSIVEASAGESPALGQIIPLLAEVSGEQPWFVLREGALLRRQVCPVTLDDSTDLALRNGGHYLITGGAGGLGLFFAESLLRRYAAKVQLVGRRKEADLPAATRRAFERLRQRFGPAALRYATADVADSSALRAIIETAQSQNGRLHGVIHAAMVLRDTSIARMSATDLTAALAPKLPGTHALLTACAEQPLDFCLMFSSAQSFLASPGQANYAAASTGQDAVAAAWRPHVPFPIQIVNWGFWGEIGAVASEDYRRSLAEVGVRSISRAEGWALTEAILHSGAEQVVPLKADAPLLEQLGFVHPNRAHSMLDAIFDFLELDQPTRTLQPGLNGGAR
ncbi:MAG: SDR family NAD(P)-dependent oxidoreductase, partial [Verrucomicrobiota bacterium JB022]|nr:SDR family NAD(P)-dependent oxidoreductase [Verrucomicrobiota bacterium JB022]